MLEKNEQYTDISQESYMVGLKDTLMMKSEIHEVSDIFMILCRKQTSLHPLARE